MSWKINNDRSLLAAAVIAALAGCASHAPLADATPLSAASQRVYDGFVATHGLVTREIEQFSTKLPCPIAGHTPTPTLTPSECFSRHWQARIAAVRALVAYSNRLADTLGQRIGDEDRLEGVVGAADQLLRSLQLPGVPGALSKAIQSVYNGWKRDRAARTAREALDKADNHVQAIISTLVADMTDARGLLINLRAKLTIELIERHKPALALRKPLEQRRSEIAVAFATAGPDRSKLIAELEQIESLLARLPTREGLVPARLDASLRVLDAAGEALAAWGRAHRDLAKALRDNQPPDLYGLVSIADQVRSKVNELRSER